MQLSDTDNAIRVIPLLRLGFRPFFLFAALFSVISLSLWGLIWSDAAEFINKAVTPYGNWFWWHGHEMLFGFAAAVIAGFLLTAVQNWTGQRGLKGYPLFALFSLWLLSRITLLLPDYFPTLLIVVLDIGFLPAVAGVMGFFVIRTRLWRNILFVPVLLLMAVLNGFMHRAALDNNMLLYKEVATATIFLIIFLVSLVGGRVIPMFTANATHTPKVLPVKWLEISALASILLLALGTVLAINDAIMGALCFLASISHLLRIGRWRTWLTFATPLLWSLHTACWFLVLGFLQLAFFHWGWIDDYISVLHTLTIGVIGLMILAMIARVSLGHTGRKLQTGPMMTLAFAAVIVACLLRSLWPLLLPHMSINIVYNASILCWVAGFIIFVFIYWPVLTRARVDGRDG